MDYYLVQFADQISKKTSQLTLGDMLKFNRWRATEHSKDISPEPEKLLIGEPKIKFQRNKETKDEKTK